MLSLWLILLLQFQRETRVQSPEVPLRKKHDPIVYHELQRLGTGAIGSVSRVIDLQLGRFMAVKIIPVEEGKEKDLKETAKKEVELIAKLDHVSLSSMSAFGYLLIVMNRNTSLNLCIRKVGKWESRFRYSCLLPTVLCEIIQVQKWKKKKSFWCLSKSYLLYNTCMERDLCTEISNSRISYTKIVPRGWPFLADFGYATRIDSKITCVGTRMYIAPEVWFGAYQDFGLDIWSLGAVIYEISKKKTTSLGEVDLQMASLRLKSGATDSNMYAGMEETWPK